MSPRPSHWAARGTCWWVRTVVSSPSGPPAFTGRCPGIGKHVHDIVGIALTPDNGGYYEAGPDGHAYGFGDAHPFGEPSALASNLPVALTMADVYVSGTSMYPAPWARPIASSQCIEQASGQRVLAIAGAQLCEY